MLLQILLMPKISIIFLDSIDKYLHHSSNHEIYPDLEIRQILLILKAKPSFLLELWSVKVLSCICSIT